MMIKCPNCKFRGEVQKKTPGHFCLEVILWLVFFPVGVVYSVWRLTQTGYYCPRCDFKNVIKED